MTELYRSGQKVIWYRRKGFEPAEFCIAWVIALVLYPAAMYHSDGHSFVRISEYKAEALEGKGSGERIEDIQPYSDELWKAITELRRRAGAITSMKATIRKGKVPDKLFQIGLGM